MELEFILKILVLVVGFYMAWNIGANDVSNAMGTSVGSGALTLRRAVLIAAVLEFSGAFFLGSNVSETMQSGLIDVEMFSNDKLTLIMGMCGALLGTSIWLQIASYFGWPVSTTHAIVGAIVGFGALIGGASAIQWQQIGSIALSWIVSPVMSGIFSYLVFCVLQQKILFAMNPSQATRKLMPYLVFCVFAVFAFSFIFKGLTQFHLTLSLPETLGWTLLVASTMSLVSYLFLRKLQFTRAELSATYKFPSHSVISMDKAIKHMQRVQAALVDKNQPEVGLLLNQMRSLSQTMRSESQLAHRTSEYAIVEKFFGYLQIVSACFVAFAHGANDVANAIGPVAAVLGAIQQGGFTATTKMPTWLLAFGGLGIVLGLAMWGWRVIETIGKKITELTPSRGFCAEFGAATTILIASKLGLPISTTHCLVGAVLGVGFAGGIRALNLRTLNEIVLSWIVTIPASAIMSVLAYYGLKALLT